MQLSSTGKVTPLVQTLTSEKQKTGRSQADNLSFLPSTDWSREWYSHVQKRPIWQSQMCVSGGLLSSGRCHEAMAIMIMCPVTSLLSLPSLIPLLLTFEVLAL